MSKAKRDISGLLKSAKEKGNRTTLRVNEILQKMIKEDHVITFSQVAEQAQVSRSWLYKNDKIKNQIETIREKQCKKTAIDLAVTDKPDQKFIIEQLKQRIKKVQQENRILREQIEVIYGKMVEKETK